MTLYDDQEKLSQALENLGRELRAAIVKDWRLLLVVEAVLVVVAVVWTWWL